MSQTFQEVVRRPDGSYVINKNGYPYHVPNEDEWVNLYAEVHTYALANPTKVTEELPPPPPPVPTEQERLEALQRNFTNAVQLHMDKFVQTRGYDNLDSMSKYKGVYPIGNESQEEQILINKFRTEAEHIPYLVSLTWAKCYIILNDVLSGKRPEPTIEDILSELPKLKWPDEL